MKFNAVLQAYKREFDWVMGEEAELEELLFDCSSHFWEIKSLEQEEYQFLYCVRGQEIAASPNIINMTDAIIDN